MKPKPLPPIEYLKECFVLDETSPSGLRWKVRPQGHFATIKSCNLHNLRYANNQAGILWTNSQYPDSQYWTVKISGNRYVVHRIVYSLLHNELISIDFQIDHIDRDGLNNSFKNLRLATTFTNNRNRRRHKNGSSGHKGVSFRKDMGMWRGRAAHNGKVYYTGYSPSKEVIVQLVKELREKLHKDFCHH